MRQIAVSPRDGTIVLTADPDGDEFTQLYLLDPAEGWPDQITDEPEVQHFVTGGAFSPDGTKLAYSANARTPTDMHVWIRELETGETRHVFGDGMYAVAFDWSPDGTKLLAVDFRDNSDTSIHIVDLESGETTEATPHDEDGVYEPGTVGRRRIGLLLPERRGSGVPRARVLRRRCRRLRLGGDT